MTTRAYFRSWRLVGASLLIFYFFFTACERNTGREDLSDPNASLLVVEATIDDTENVDLNSPLNGMGSIRNSARLSNKSDISESGNNSTYVEGDGFDVITSVGNGWKGENSDANVSPISSKGSFPRAASPMTPGFKYRLVLYKVVGATQTFWRQKQLTSSTSNVVDTTQQIEVVRGDSYQWYAYSYNNANDIPPLATTGSNPAVSMGTNSDFLYATGTFTILPTGAANTPLAINFRHQVGRLALEIDARGMFADNITQLNVTLGGMPDASAPLTNGTFGLVSGQVVASVPYTPTTTLAVGNFQNVDAGFNDRKAIYFHSATPATLTNLAITLNSVTITMTDGTTTRAFPTLNRVYTLAVPSPLAAGRTHNAKIDLVESALPFQGVNWARTNLYLHSSGRNPYRFHATYAHTDMRESFWPFRSNTPYMFSSGTVGPNSDPCAFVHPTSRPSDGLSVWRQASAADLATLGSNDLLLGLLPLVTTPPANNIIYAQTNGRGYYEYATTGSANQYPSSNLRFNMNGFGTAIDVVSGLITINIGQSNYGTEARIWSQDRLIELGNVLGLGAYGLRARRVTASLAGPYNLLTPNVIEVLSVGVLGAGLLQSSFQNVRCVRR